MKVLNVVLSVLILLLAAASAVFAFFLFEKREQMTDGWSKMAQAINRASVQLDTGSETTVAANLNEKKLSHLEYAGLPGALKTFQNQVEQIMAQRNALALSLSGAGANAGMTDVPSAKDLMSLASSAQGSATILAGIQAIKEQNVDTLARIAAVANTLGVTGQNFAGASTYSNAFNAFDQRAAAITKQLSTFRSGLGVIASTLGGSIDAVNDSNYTEMMKKVQTLSAESTAKINDRNEQIAALNKTVQQRDTQIGELNKKVEEQQGQIALNEAQISRLIAVIDPESNGKQPALWDAGSEQARRALQGRVLEVNDKYGIIMVDLGHNTRVQQLVGRNRVEVDPMIPEGAVMAVVREFPDGEAEYVGRLKLTRVNDNCSVAEMVRGSSTKPVRVGDIVIFTSNDLAALK